MLRQTSAPDLDERAVSGYGHHVAFGAALNASAPHGHHLGAGFIQPPRPGLHQYVDSTGAQGN
jgi:hypothetical protein